MKLAVSPAIEPRIGWRKTVREQRAEIDLLLDDAPSLRQTMGAVVGKGWTRRRIRCGRHWRIMVKSRALTWVVVHQGSGAWGLVSRRSTSDDSQSDIITNLTKNEKPMVFPDTLEGPESQPGWRRGERNEVRTW